MKTTNFVLYAVKDGVRQPVFSLTPGDPFAVAKISGHVGAVMSECAKSGAVLPDFHVTRETREANEQGIVIAAEMCEMDATCSKVLRTAPTVDDLFAKIAASKLAPVAEVAESAEVKATKAARKKSAALSK